ncbi:type III secretion system outer membrane ring subunit SctC [Burkholderia oklahomensis]|uniref:type III secretion system outer membrane ring subunit SctC n=1 Tax=Burkholderia oklahomensis TaxID=342113 RepID=UPI00016A9B65|nr:type III secretion system outer membrane ring subunit SctC [Burkholderia oklahomensis]AJX35033.1 type III secretion outer membrane pore, YscC/HrcC family [Burkholderia oklahomensis C6786]AOI48621.1 secretin [Burkholderia oklahomensis C6786]KUY47407.1 secretin [Burkholderia oklahomensis C6786]MBI0363202.1 type III secretion system outer membrane ring subunit SctC [Burkholderia oklahomensis]SUY27314.1 outer membrane secretin SsaC [Burkholderia oklahomensis]
MKAKIPVLLSLLCTLASVPADAAPVRWRSSEIQYAAEGKDVKDVLRDLAASQNIAANVASGVSGAVSGKMKMSPQRFLDTLAASFGFVWYYDGTVLYVTPSSDMKSTLVKLDHANTGDLRDLLEQMKVADPRYPIVYNARQRTALVAGPPRYVELVTSVAARLDENASRTGGTTIRVFSLKHAWAADRDVNVDGATVTMPGVASLLNRMYRPGGDGKHASQTTVGRPISRAAPMMDLGGGRSGVPPLPPLPPYMQTAQAGDGGGGLGARGNPAGDPRPSAALASALANQGAARAPGGVPDPFGGGASGVPVGAGDPNDLPVIQADPRTNSILVRDVPEHMAQYPDLIALLDVKPRLIEIEARIIEIDEGALKQLGVDWRAHNSHIDLQTGTGLTAQNSYANGSLNPTFGSISLSGNGDSVGVPASPLGLSLTAVLGDAGRYLLARINALESSNQARTDASPKVTTLDNVEAVMDNKKQFFVRVAGYTSADLYSISTGVSLRVLPMVVEEGGHTQIKLDVRIVDGELSQQTVDNIPVIVSNEINTQAFIEQGQALLIAGYKVDSRSSTLSGVPVLSKLPLVGALFRSTDKQDSHTERLFLVTPRVIEP